MSKNKQDDTTLSEEHIRFEDHLPPVDWKHLQSELGVKRQHTQDEMLLALRRLEQVKSHLDLLRDDDDPLAVMADVITEVLEKRQSIAGVTNFMQQWLAEHTRR